MCFGQTIKSDSESKASFTVDWSMVSHSPFLPQKVSNAIAPAITELTTPRSLLVRGRLWLFKWSDDDDDGGDDDDEDDDDDGDDGDDEDEDEDDDADDNDGDDDDDE